VLEFGEIRMLCLKKLNQAM